MPHVTCLKFDENAVQLEVGNRRMTSQEIWTLGKSTADKWSEHNAPRLSAALAYYTLLSLAPVLVLLILICGVVFTHGTAEQHLLDEVGNLAGDEWVGTLRSLIKTAQPTKTGVIASIIAVVVVFFGASSVFLELREALNTIWDAPLSKSGVKNMVRKRIASFAMVLTFGFLMLSSTLLDLGLHVLQTLFASFVPVGTTLIGGIANFAISFVAITILFALIFKFVPDVRIDWRDVGVGAVLTAVLFTIGHSLLSLYLTKAAVGSAYGAAGSLVAFVAWIYYCAQIFFFGAIFTRVYATTFGSHPPSKESAQSKSTAGAK